MTATRGWITALLLALTATAGITKTPEKAGNAKLPSALLDAPALADRIDRLIEAELAVKGSRPAPLADDAEFLRRIYLDLTGRIPRVSEARAFLSDKSPDRRVKLVESLLDSPRYVLHMGNTWRNMLVPPGSNQQFVFFQPGFKTWLDKQVQGNIAYDKMIRELLTVPLNNNNQPGLFIGGRGQLNGASPAAYYQANEFKAENLAASTSRLFLGVRLECAQCHDHPFAKWTRKQFWEYAAFFSGTQPGRVIPNKGQLPMEQPKFGREIKIPGTDKLVSARFLDGNNPEWQDKVDSRVTLAEWFTSPLNPYFARTGANRVWAHFFGIGIIDPVDDEPTEENPSSHPELLTELTAQFTAHEFDIKYLIRAITASKTYQRTSAVTHPSQNEPRLFAHMALKGMSPEQLFDSLAVATGYQEANQGPNARLAALNAPNSPRGEFLNLFSGQDKKTETQTSILQALALMNGKFVSDATSLERSRTLAAMVDGPFSNTQRIETLYLASVGRLPRSEEARRLLAYVESAESRPDPRTAYADIFWALLNSSEFIFNH